MNPAALLHEHLTVWRGTTSTTLHSHFHATTSGDNVTEDEMVARILDLVTPAPGRLSHQHLTALVTEIASLLDDDATLSEELRAHLHMVVAHMRDCLANPDRYDLADLAEAAEDLLGAAKNAAEETTDPRTRSRWEKFRDGIVYPTVAGLIVNGATAGMPLLITAGQHLLNQG